ncbi:hypothetical protein Hanom_Chr16g01484031 [Helianthus anomalus]
MFWVCRQFTPRTLLHAYDLHSTNRASRSSIAPSCHIFLATIVFVDFICVRLCS